ncbi:MAG: thermonuclease family protein [Desulfotalea sp.]
MLRITILIIPAFYILFGLSWCVYAESGYVTKVIDGDSLLVKGKNKKKIEIRLYGVDSPEWNQKNAKYASKYLRKKILKKKINYLVYDYDRYGRAVAVVKHRDVNINETLVRYGYAWVYPKYCKKNICKRWKNLQQQAKKMKKGIWQEKKPVSPWSWRRKK